MCLCSHSASISFHDVTSENNNNFLQLRQFRDVSNTLVCLFERANETLKEFNMYVEICLTTSHTTVSNSKLMRFGYFFIIQSALHCFVFFKTICLRSLNQSAKQDKTIEGRLYSASVIKSVHLNLVLLFVVHCFFFLAVTKPDTVTQFSVCGAAQLLYCELSSKSLAQS